MADYKKIGLKAGVEIHQQLATHKLFCSCPSVLRRERPDIVVKRELRPLAGELGKIDPAAIFERKKRKYYLYEAYRDTTCLVELDEEPPHPINRDALNIALLIAKMLNCKFPDFIEVMRKTVIDGSNTSGFQRTVLMGYDGFVNTSFGRTGIQTVILEEDSARRMSETREFVIFRLDRLGIPLIEIATAPDCSTPEQVREVAEKLGLLLRSTGRVMRGIGTIRQDLNISVKGHPRVELKGVQDLRHIPKIVELEAKRQLKELKTKKKLESQVRNVLPDLETKFLRPMPGAARMYPETDLPLVKLDKRYIKELKLPESPEKIKAKLRSAGLSSDLAGQMAASEHIEEFMRFAKKYKKLGGNLIAAVILTVPKEVKRKLKLRELELSEEFLNCIFEGLAGGSKVCPAIVKESVPQIIEAIAKEKPGSLEALKIIMSRYKVMSDAELKRELAKIKREFRGPPNKLVGYAIGKLRGRADPQKISKLLKK